MRGRDHFSSATSRSAVSPLSRSAHPVRPPGGLPVPVNSRKDALMAKDGRLIYACAGALGLAGLLVCSPSLGADKQDNAVTASLAVQTALQQGRESLVRGDA